MIEILSYLRDSHGRFWTISEAIEASMHISDPNYIEGAVVMSINGVTITDRHMVDYVDQLWAYISHIMVDVVSRGAGSTFFPDQAIELTCCREDGEVIRVRVRENGTRESVVSAREFVPEVCLSGIAFFSEMAQLLPSKSRVYMKSISRFESATSSFMDRL